MATRMSGGRRRRSREEIGAIVAEYERSGLPQRDFAERRGIAVGTLRGWLRRARRDRFVEIRTDEVGAASAGGYAVELSPGIRIEVPPGFDPADLGALLLELKGAGCLP